MKNTLAVRVFGDLCRGVAFGGTIAVIQPAGGTVTMGAATPIAWTASNVAGNVKIQLIRPGGALVGQLAGNIAAGGSPWSWAVAAPAVVGETYKVRVRAMDGSAEGVSADFTVAAPSPAAAIHVTQPASTVKWHRNETCDITWTKSGAMPTAVKISLMDKNSASVFEEIVDGVANSGSFSWLVPADITLGDYRVRVLVKTTDIKDDSDTFSIAAAKISQDTAFSRSAPLPMTPDPYPDCDKYEEQPQITNWGSPRNHADLAIMAVYESRPKGLPQGAPSGSYAHVGYDHFLRPDTSVPAWTTFCYRSRVWVNMARYQNVERSKRRLVAAKLHLKQFNSLISGDSHASCAVGLAVFWPPGPTSGISRSRIKERAGSISGQRTIRWISPRSCGNGWMRPGPLRAPAQQRGGRLGAAGQDLLFLVSCNHDAVVQEDLIIWKPRPPGARQAARS